MKYFCLIILALLILSCSEPPTRDNPYDTYFDLPEPENLQVEHISLTIKKVTWEYELENIDGFILSRKQNENWTEIASIAADKRSYIDTLSINEIVQYKIVAYADQNYSDEMVSDYFDNTIPAPSELQYEHINIYIIQFNWQDNSEGEDGVKIDKKVGENDWIIEYATTNQNDENWIDEEAEVNEDLYYRVYSYYVNYNSSYLETGLIDNSIPIPENLELEINFNSDNIILTWVYYLAGIEGFRIEKKSANGNWSLYADNLEPESREWIDNYPVYLDSYRIKAFYQEYESDHSDEIMYGIEGMIYVEGGTFEMGDHYGDGYSYELPIHDVTLSSFWISQHEVTQAEYEEVTGENPAHNYGAGDDYPVYYVSWYDAVEYCNALSIQKGLTTCYDTSDWSCNFNANGFRLPTEAEWEYAARGGIHWEDNYKYSGTTDDLDSYAWYYDNSVSHTHEVETKLPNQLGIYDMSGNVWEWCNDRYSSSYYETSPEDDPTGPDTGSPRVSRGGSWISHASYCRVADRYSDNPAGSNLSLGFRFARSSR